MFPGEVGSVSENATAVKAIEFVFPSVKVIVETPFVVIVAGEKDFVIVGRIRTSREHVAGESSDVFVVVSICCVPIVP
jgi:hypothetical protein